MVETDDRSNPLSNRTLRNIQLMFVALLLLLAGWAVVTYPQVVRQGHDDEIEKLIYGLRLRRPAGMSRGQWGAAVGWTGQMHGNSQLWIEADAKELAAFHERLEQKLEQPVDLQTIYWIWDEYSRLTPHGLKYQKFKDVMDEEITAAAMSSYNSWHLDIP